MIIALAGRRIDARDETAPHFPFANRALVRERLRDAFVELRAAVLVCSAACGGDLLALEVAEDLGVQRHIILPFGAHRFKQRSVVDRPGDWGPLFDRMYGEAMANKRVLILRGHGWGHAAEEVVTTRILDRALALAHAGGDEPRARSVTAIGVWDLASRRPNDLTAHFLAMAAARGIPVRDVSTI